MVGPQPGALVDYRQSGAWPQSVFGEGAGYDFDQGIDAMTEPDEKKSELKAFLFLTVVMAPILAGVIVATYGFAVWIYQMFAGPPGA